MSPSSTPAGLTLKVLSVKQVKSGPAKVDTPTHTAWNADIPKGVTLITVEYSLHNSTSTPIAPVPEPGVDYGPNAIPADDQQGWMGETTLHNDHNPQRVGAGQTVTLWRSWMLPTDQIAQAEIGVTTGYGAPAVTVPLA